MPQWDDLRERLRSKQDEVAETTKRSNQEHEIVRLQQGNLWTELEGEFVEAVAIINNGRTVLGLSPVPNATAIKISAVRAGKQIPTANILFNEKINEVNVSYSGVVAGGAPQLRYTIRAGSDNRAEFSRGGESVDKKEIVNETISHLA